MNETVIQVTPKLCWVVREELKVTMGLFRKNHWGCRIAGHGPMLTSPYEAHNWRFIPLNQDNSNIPKEAMERKDAIEKAGIAIKGWIVGHEIEEEKEVQTEVNLPRKANETNVEWEMIALLALGLLVFPLLIFGFAMMSCFSGDPSLIAVLDDEESTWLEVYRWYE